MRRHLLALSAAALLASLAASAQMRSTIPACEPDNGGLKLPDSSLYIAESTKGRLSRVMYRGSNR